MLEAVVSEAAPRRGRPFAKLLPRLIAAPGALGRSGRRLTLTGLMTLESLRHVRESFAPTAGASERARVEYLSWFAENFCALHGIHLRLRGRLPASPSVLVANHVSYVDPLVISSLLPCTAIAKRELGSWPIVGEVLCSAGILMLQRNDSYSGARVLRAAMCRLEAGISVLAFPEGTTTAGLDVLPLQRGMFGVARRLALPIVPIAISYDDPTTAWVGDQTFLPHYVRTTTRRRIRATVSFGEPVSPGGRSSPEDLAERVRRDIRTLLRA